MVTETLMARLKAKDSETRLAAFRLIDIIFQRMHAFRQLIIDDHLKTIVVNLDFANLLI